MGCRSVLFVALRFPNCRDDIVIVLDDVLGFAIGKSAEYASSRERDRAAVVECNGKQIRRFVVSRDPCAAELEPERLAQIDPPEIRPLFQIGFRWTESD